MNDQTMIPNPSQPNVYGPITAGQMFERTFRLLRENFELFFGIVLILVGVHIVAMGVFGGSEFWMVRSHSGTPPVGSLLLMLPVFFVGGILFFIFVLIIQGAFFIATRARLSGAAMTVGEACKLAADKAGRLTGIALLVFVRMAGYLLLFYVVSVILALIVALMFGGLRHVSGAVPFAFGHGASLGLIAMFTLFVLLWLVLYLMFVFWLYARYSLSVPAALAEDQSVTESIRRSIDLSRGSKGRIYAMLLAIVGLYLVFDAVLFPVEIMVLHPFHAHPAGIGAGMGFMFLAISVLSLAMWALAMVFVGVATALCYYDLRVRKEGFGVVTPPPPTALPIAPAEPPPPDEPTADLPIS